MLSKLELLLLKELYKRYRKTKVRELWRATEAFSFLEISGDISPIHDSVYINIELDGTHECFQITSEGIRYMDNLPNWTQKIIEAIKKHGIQVLITVVATIIATYFVSKLELSHEPTEGVDTQSDEQISTATATPNGTTTFPGVYWSEVMNGWVHY